MPQFNGDVIFLDGSGQVRATNGDLTLRGDDTGTRSIIIGSGLSLRPERDVRTDLGRPDLRWHVLHAGRSNVPSGFVDLLEPLTNNGQARIGSPLNRFSALYAQSGVFSELVAQPSGNTVFVHGHVVPGEEHFTLGTVPARWAQVHMNSGFVWTSLQFQSPATIEGAVIANASFDFENATNFNTGSVTFFNAGSILQIDGTTDFGSTPDFEAGARLFGAGSNLTTSAVGETSIGVQGGHHRSVYAVSGFYNAILPLTSGTSLAVHGTAVPGIHNVYSLGTSALRWGNLFAVSGTIGNLSTSSLAASAATFDDLVLGNSLTLTLDGFTITQAGQVFWDLGGTSLDLLNGTLNAETVVATTITAADINSTTNLNAFGNFGVLGLALLNGGTFFGNASAPNPDVSYPMGLQGFRFTSLYAVSGFIETINPLPSGGQLTVNGSIFPDRDLLRGLGGTARRWATIEAGSGMFATAATIKGATVVTNKDARTTVHAVVTANSGAIINSSAERDIYNYTIPANALSASGKLILECIGSFTNMAGANVNLTPRVYINGTAIWGDVFAVPQGPRPADFGIYAEICALGSLTGQRVRGSVELGSRTAGSITGNGDFAAANGGVANWSSVATSGTVDYSTPVNIRVSMQLGTASTNASYSGFHCIMSHQPFPGV